MSVVLTLLRGSLIAAILALGPQATARGAATPLRPPHLPEKATPNSVASFPCRRSPVSTLDIEACEGHALLKLGHTFNERVSVLWPLLDTAARGAFVRAHAAWLDYRRQECTASARRDLGGTGAGVVFGQCEIDLTRARVSEVGQTVSDYCSGRVRTGPYRRCPRP